ncbi:D-alanyl-D-alanine carboxypeptidase family protein [Candidatus Pseudoscillospira sp. SGI.172]|uniref:D-alanyl-D-alanine carboxypeptidase family protein n=1 Tax=Candidatus Pseudoscillospira sp. SGI.172 TaxID=3420582 RepID=UPI0009BC5163|nr:D-alanyl-D-alanine carboxypeptidase [Pseudoflavonifractor sp.]MDY3020236.1 D-alanyl-D-alanine carboxypeptidase family protein [Oscillospiraceae bacterium]
MKKYRSIPAFFLLLSLLTTLLTPALATEESDSFTVNAASALLLDADHDEVLYEQNADERRFPASITKVMTGLLTAEAIDRGELSLDTQVTLGDDLYTGIGEGGSTQDLKPGEVLTVRDLLNCALIPSANEACNALASLVAGSIPAFVDLMNQRAAELGMTGTHFVNPHGYHDDDHYTTARDVSRMCLEAMKHPDFRQIVSSVSYTVPATNLHAERVLHDTNALVSNFRVRGFLYQYAIGIKTGSTPEAGYCLASAAEKNGRTMIGVILGGVNWKDSAGNAVENNYFRESKNLLEYGFNHFSRKTILSGIDPIGTIPVKLCADQDYVTVQPASSLEASLPNDLDPASFQRQIDLPERLDAPIEKGQPLGTITLSYEGKEYGTIELVATSSLERSQFLFVIDQIQRFFSHLWVKLLLLVLVLLILIFFLRRLFLGPSRRNRRGGRAPRVYRSNYRGRRR